MQLNILYSSPAPNNTLSLDSGLLIADLPYYENLADWEKGLIEYTAIELGNVEQGHWSTF